MCAKRSRSSPWRWLPAIAACVVASASLAYWGIDNWRQITPADEGVARYRVAPPCPAGPAPGCRAAIEGTIERADIRRVTRRTRRQWLTVRFPATVREIEMPRNVNRRDTSPYPALQMGTTVTAEWWEEQVVTLTVGGVVERTQAHPGQAISRLRNSRDTALLFIAFLLPLTGLLWWLSRREASYHTSSEPG